MSRSKIIWVMAVLSFVFISGLEADVSVSLANESLMSMHRGAAYLLERQAENGSWSGEPSITALAVKVLHNSSAPRLQDDIDDAIARGREFILEHVQEGGAISGVYQPYLNYTTSLCLIALSELGRPEDEEVMRDARRFLIDLQLREDHPEHPTSPENPFYGGIGYGSGGPEAPDLSNTQFALEALYRSAHLDTSGEGKKSAQSAFARAILYLRSVQRIPADADSDWTYDPERDLDSDGGFIYRPDQCRVREQLTHEFEGEPTSYGATTAGGLKSLLYAGVDRDDYRVQAAIEWIKRNYTLEENPVIGPEAHYYHLWTFAKAMDAYGEEILETADGQERSWRRDLLLTLLNLQQADGHWRNEKSGRYMESIPELTTAYALIAMQTALEDVLKGQEAGAAVVPACDFVKTMALR